MNLSIHNFEESSINIEKCRSGFPPNIKSTYALLILSTYTRLVFMVRYNLMYLINNPKEMISTNVSMKLFKFFG